MDLSYIARRFAKAITAGLSAGVASVVLYSQATPVNISDPEPYLFGLAVAFLSGAATAFGPANAERA